MSTGLVLVLDGPSSVGKSTTLSALQRRWPGERSGPLVTAGLDTVRAALGEEPGRRWAELIDRVEPSVAGRSPRFRYGPLGRTLIGAMHRTAATWARAGIDVGIDHCLLDAAMMGDLRGACDGLPLVVLGMTCDPVVLDDREAGRRDVVAGRSAGQRAAVLDVRHDAVIDTTAATTDEVVEEVLGHVRQRLRA